MGTPRYLRRTLLLLNETRTTSNLYLSKRLELCLSTRRQWCRKTPLPHMHMTTLFPKRHLLLSSIGRRSPCHTLTLQVHDPRLGDSATTPQFPQKVAEVLEVTRVRGRNDTENSRSSNVLMVTAKYHRTILRILRLEHG